ncbi:MAG TPA: glucose 1-dehydrogenase [Polyangiaceae bacterium]|nr:glucose 1-dehydrogenase [Polyangiaceae bacterium]
MWALTVVPRVPSSVVLRELPEPTPSEGQLLVQCLAVGVCGTDHDIVEGRYGLAPEGEGFLILGHESLGRVLQAPRGSSWNPGDLVVGVVRRPDPAPCPSCAVGEWDMCSNGDYTERGIKGRHGFAAERFLLESDFAIRVAPTLAALGVLLEPCSVMAKAWEQIDRIGARGGAFQPRTVLITGAGPIGLLGALLSVQRGYEVHVFDRVESGPKPELVRELGAEYHSGDLKELGFSPDIVLECTGAGRVVLDSLVSTAPNGIVCLVGLSSSTQRLSLNPAELNNSMVLDNAVVFGCVNANLRHYRAAEEALMAAPPAWLARLISRRVPLADWPRVFEHPPDDIKSVLQFSE